MPYFATAKKNPITFEQECTTFEVSTKFLNQGIRFSMDLEEFWNIEYGEKIHNHDLKVILYLMVER